MVLVKVGIAAESRVKKDASRTEIEEGKVLRASRSRRLQPHFEEGKGGQGKWVGWWYLAGEDGRAVHPTPPMKG